MSLESAVATATEQLGLARQDLLAISGQIAGQVAAVGTAYTQRINTLLTTFFVSHSAGNDANAGTAAAPFKTIQKALAVTPRGGYCVVRLMGDITLASDVVIDQKHLSIQFDPAAPATRYRIFPTRVTHPTNGTRQIAGFRFQGVSSLNLYGVALDMPRLDGAWINMTAGYYATLFTHQDWTSAAMFSVVMTYCDLYLPTDQFSNFFWNVGPQAFQIENCVLVGARTTLNGILIAGVTGTGGAPINNYPHILGNLTTV